MYCRSSKIGVTKYECSTCDRSTLIYRSCKNRFCPKCGTNDTKKWAANSLSRLCNMKHHHVVFTLPKPLRFMAKLNEKYFYNLLFKATSMAVIDWFKNKHNIKPGIVAVLHTAGSDLKFHPHIHMIVSAGGIELKTKSIEQLSSYFLTRQRFLAEKFKQFFFKELFKDVANNKIKLPHKFIDKHDSFFKWARSIRDKHWVVSIQKPLDNVSHIVNYVGRYTKRACLSEYNIVNVSTKKIDIKFNDYKNTPKNQKPVKSIKSFTVNEFFDELLQHVPIHKFRLVRYYGLYASCYKKNVQQFNNLKPIDKDLKDLKDQKIQFDETHILIEGDFEQYRRINIQNGNGDPLLCNNCNSIMNFDGVYYYENIVHDSS